MLRRLATLLLACAPVSAPAAPVPKEDDTARMARVYGTPLDPDKDCKFEPRGDALRITIPGAPHALTSPFIRPHYSNAPRVWRGVTGDFTATVRVTFTHRPKPGPETSYEGGTYGARSGAGLVAWSAAGDFAVLTRDELSLDGKVTGELSFYRHSPKGTQTGADFLTPGDSAYLRLSRKGQKVAAEFSADAKRWKELGSAEVTWGEAVKVGVFAHTRYEAGFTAVFDEYLLAVPKK